jgi:predicted regulator of Ras-like GTPase activity (Roadblock/LC7/MglB family)
MSSSIETISSALAAMSDVVGYEASVVLTPDGQIVAEHGLASDFADQIQAAGPRIARLSEAFVSGKGALSLATLRYSQKVLILLPVLDCFLLVAAHPTTNLTILKTVVAVAARRIKSAGGEAAGPVPHAPEESAQQADPSKKYEMVYRGIRVR